MNASGARTEKRMPTVVLARRGRRQRRVLRLRLAVAGAAALSAMVAPVVLSFAPRLVWNASASAPVGLYRVWPDAVVARGDMVVARVPEPWRGLAARRHYLPANVPLVKRVAARADDEVCARGRWILIDGKPAAARLARDPSSRNLPWWQGCRRLRSGEFFLLTNAPTSFDGRYFGVSSAGDIVGRAKLIWHP